MPIIHLATGAYIRWDDTTRTVTTYDETGAVTSTRPYTAEENAAAHPQRTRLDSQARPHHPRGLGAQRRNARRVDRQRPRLTTSFN